MPEQLRYDYVVDPGVDSVATKILGYVPPGARVLDLGCGPGALAREMVARGASVTGVELDPVAAKRAEAAGVDVSVADLDTADLTELLGGRVFDVVVAADVLEHLRDPLATLRQVRELLAPAGYLVVSAPNVAHASVRLALLAGSFPYSDTGLLDRTHLHFWTRETLLSLLAEAGFPAVHVQHQDLGPFDSEVPVPEPARQPAAVAAATAGPDALAYQYVVLAVPEGGDAPPLVRVLTHLVGATRDTLAAAEARVAELTAELARFTGVDPLVPEGVPAPETVQALLAARDEAHRAQTQLDLVTGQLHYTSEALARAEADRAAWQTRAKEIDRVLADTEAARAALAARWERLAGHPVGRAARLLRRALRRARAAADR